MWKWMCHVWSIRDSLFKFRDIKFHTSLDNSCNAYAEVKTHYINIFYLQFLPLIFFHFSFVLNGFHLPGIEAISAKKMFIDSYRWSSFYGISLIWIRQTGFQCSSFFFLNKKFRDFLPWKDERYNRLREYVIGILVRVLDMSMYLEQIPSICLTVFRGLYFHIYAKILGGGAYVQFFLLYLTIVVVFSSLL